MGQGGPPQTAQRLWLLQADKQLAAVFIPSTDCSNADDQKRFSIFTAVVSLKQGGAAEPTVCHAPAASV